MPYQKNLLVLFCLISFLGLFGGAQLAGALGQITEPIVIESALRGQSATAILSILNSESKEIKVNLGPRNLALRNSKRFFRQVQEIRKLIKREGIW